MNPQQHTKTKETHGEYRRRDYEYWHHVANWREHGAPQNFAVNMNADSIDDIAKAMKLMKRADIAIRTGSLDAFLRAIGYEGAPTPGTKLPENYRKHRFSQEALEYYQRIIAEGVDKEYATLAAIMYPAGTVTKQEH